MTYVKKSFAGAYKNSRANPNIFELVDDTPIKEEKKRARRIPKRIVEDEIKSNDVMFDFLK